MTSTYVQSVLFDREKWTPKKAVKWLDKHQHVHYKIDATEHHLRFRQVTPDPSHSYFTLKLGHGVKYIMGRYTPRTRPQGKGIDWLYSP
jgi:hypothetical protein